MRMVLACCLVTVASLYAAPPPGFRVLALGSTAGFASSIAVDSHGTIYYTTTSGDLFRFVDGRSTRIAHVNTEAVGDSGLLGMALKNDQTAVLHYTSPGQVSDIVSAVDLTSGIETALHSFVCDKDLPSRGSPPEHHGGNPTVAADGSIFVGIGDYGGGLVAALPDWNAGKIFRIFPDGSVMQFARGLRNPFDTAWDATRQRLIVPDNGPGADDEINVVREGDDCGWPFTAGNGPEIDGAVAPLYTFPVVVAPTGLIALSGRNPILNRGYLLGSFVARALYYIPDIDARPFPDPIPVIQGETEPIIDVAEEPDGTIDFITGNAVYRLAVVRNRAVRGWH